MNSLNKNEQKEYYQRERTRIISTTGLQLLVNPGLSSEKLKISTFQ